MTTLSQLFRPDPAAKRSDYAASQTHSGDVSVDLAPLSPAATRWHAAGVALATLGLVGGLGLWAVMLCHQHTVLGAEQWFAALTVHAFRHHEAATACFGFATAGALLAWVFPNRPAVGWPCRGATLVMLAVPLLVLDVLAWGQLYR